VSDLGEKKKSADLAFQNEKNGRQLLILREQST